MDYKRLLLSVGVTTFVEFYEVFEANRFSGSCEEIMDALSKKGIWKESSIRIKASCGKKIFTMKMETEALKHIAFKVHNVDDSIKEKVKEILHNKGIGILELVLEHL